MIYTSGRHDSVWVALNPYSNWPKFQKLDRDIESDTVIVGAGMAGISTAYELVKKGVKTVLIDAREVTSGETGRTSGHLSDFIGLRYEEMIKTHGVDETKLVYESHQYAIKRVGQIAEKHGIECEYVQLPAKVIVSVPSTDPSYENKNDLAGEPEAYRQIGHESMAEYAQNGDLGAYTGGILTTKGEAKFHPTKYLHGVLRELTENHSDLFTCYTNTRMRSYKAHDKHVEVETEGDLPPNPKIDLRAKGYSIHATNLVLTCNIPPNLADLILKNFYYRTYCIAMAIPSSDAPSALIYDNSDPYIYVRTTSHPAPNTQYLIVGGEDHKVGIESGDNYFTHFEKLMKWTKTHFPSASTTPDYAWSGQIIEANDNIAFIGREDTQGRNIFVSTGDCGNGLTHGVIASKIISDEIAGVKNPWSRLYATSRTPKPRTIPDIVSENVEQISKYSRAIIADVNDIEEIPVCSGAVMHGGLKKLGKPMAVYKDENGEVRKFSAVCPHLHGIVAWNPIEKSWDCPVHGSRFDGMTGKCVFGPSNRGLSADDEKAEEAINASTSG